MIENPDRQYSLDTTPVENPHIPNLQKPKSGEGRNVKLRMIAEKIDIPENKATISPETRRLIRKILINLRTDFATHRAVMMMTFSTVEMRTIKIMRIKKAPKPGPARVGLTLALQLVQLSIISDSLVLYHTVFTKLVLIQTNK